METIFRYNIFKILEEVNAEPELIPYWIKLDLLDRKVPIIINPMNVKDYVFDVRSGTITNYYENGFIYLIWTTNKN